MPKKPRNPRLRQVYLFDGARCVGRYRSVKAAAQAAREKHLPLDAVTIVIPDTYRSRGAVAAYVNGQPVKVEARP